MFCFSAVTRTFVRIRCPCTAHGILFYARLRIHITRYNVRIMYYFRPRMYTIPEQDAIESRYTIPARGVHNILIPIDTVICYRGYLRSTYPP